MAELSISLQFYVSFIFVYVYYYKHRNIFFSKASGFALILLRLAFSSFGIDSIRKNADVNLNGMEIIIEPIEYNNG